MDSTTLDSPAPPPGHAAGGGSPWASEAEIAQVLLILTRPGYLAALFLAGWAVNVWVFMRFRVDYGTVLGVARDEQISPRHLWLLALLLAGVLGLFHYSALSYGLSPGVIFGVLLMYVLMLLSLFAWLPPPLARRARWRVPFGRALWRCLLPVANKEVPFVEVLVADGLTSLSKVFFDLALGSCLAINSLDVSAGLAGASLLLGTHSGAPEPAHGLNATLASHTSAPPTSLFGPAMEQCTTSSVPFLAWACPFLIRARQCIVTSRNTPDTFSRDMQRVNLCKYLSALPIVLFALCHARMGPGREEPWFLFGAEDFEALWAIAAVFNSVFSFVWDLVMDWGLMQPAPWRTMNFGLRPVLVFRGIWGFYHMAIVCNLVGRMLWSLRWSPQAQLFLGSFFLTSLQQAAEVLRRCLWNVLRVEWECIRKNTHRGDKHLPM